MGLTVLTDIDDERWNAHVPDAAERIDQACQVALLKPLPGAAYEISVMLADDASVHALNKAHRGKDKPTNILSFPAFEPGEWQAETGGGQPILLGDLALAFETAAAEADARGIALADHLTHLIVHGVLHLLGFDHQGDADADEMERLETQLCGKLGIADPYEAHR